MNVIFRASDLNCGGIVFVEHTGKIGMHPFLHLGIDEECITVFC